MVLQNYFIPDTAYFRKKKKKIVSKYPNIHSFVFFFLNGRIYKLTDI